MCIIDVLCCSAVTSDVIVVLGEWDRTAADPPFPRQDHTIQEFILHPNYSESTLDNDMALIILNVSFSIIIQHYFMISFTFAI